MKFSQFAVLSLLVLPHPGRCNDTPLRWASTGGGWRAMVADMAYANVFAQAGLFDDTSSNFQAISAESGGSWFALQFFHSQPFYDTIVESSPEELSDFVLSWMDAYAAWSNRFPTDYPICKLLGRFNATEGAAEFCNEYLDSNGNWAKFVMGMLGGVSENSDPGFVNRTVAPHTRVNALQNTEEYIQTSLSPTARVRDSNTGVFIGPASTSARLRSKKEVYSLPVGVQYSVTNDDTLYFSSTDANEKLNDLTVFTKSISESFSFREWDEYPFYNGSDTKGNVLIRKPIGATRAGKMNAPFGGSRASVAQLASASSAALGSFSGLTPSMLAQYMSISLYDAQSDADKLLLQLGVDAMYKQEMFDGLTVCSQWPDAECGSMDGRFIDGTYGDSPTMALNVAQFQAREDYDENTVLKVVVTLNPNTPVTPTVLAYFQSPLNQNGTIAPGDLYWPYFDGFYGLPERSPQIFDQYLDLDMLQEQSLPLNGTNVTTYTVSATTIDNPAFQVKAGLNIEMFILRLNEGVGDLIIGEVAIDAAKGPLSEMALGIVQSTELVNRVKKFAGKV